MNRIIEKYYPLCPCWIAPRDVNSTIGMCEGGRKECRYPKDPIAWKECRDLSTGCTTCGYKSCGNRKTRTDPVGQTIPVEDQQIDRQGTL